MLYFIIMYILKNLVKIVASIEYSIFFNWGRVTYEEPCLKLYSFLLKNKNLS